MSHCSHRETGSGFPSRTQTTGELSHWDQFWSAALISMSHHWVCQRLQTSRGEKGCHIFLNPQQCIDNVFLENNMLQKRQYLPSCKISDCMQMVTFAVMKICIFKTPQVHIQFGINVPTRKAFSTVYCYLAMNHCVTLCICHVMCVLFYKYYVNKCKVHKYWLYISKT